jgi:hypothetical protein
MLYLFLACLTGLVIGWSLGLRVGIDISIYHTKALIEQEFRKGK